MNFAAQIILQSDNLDDYLRTTTVVDWHDATIQQKTADIAGEVEGEVEKARKLFEWVRDAISHSKDIGLEVVTCKASKVLERATGICYAKSHLLAAMCRCAGIPAGFCYQVYRVSHDQPTTAIHGFNALFLESLKKWIRVDARGNTGDIDAQFSTEEERLAFPVDPARGELFIYRTVFTDPVPQVLEVLNRFNNRSKMWPHLPSTIPDELLGPEDRLLNAALVAEEIK